MIVNGAKYLITTDHWFYAPDGESYRSVWGTCVLYKAEDVFGFIPARPSTNWFLRVGTEDSHLIIAGCQIHYAMRCESAPDSRFKGQRYTDKDTGVEYTADKIYAIE